MNLYDLKTEPQLIVILWKGRGDGDCIGEESENL